MSDARDTPIVRQWLVLRQLGARRLGVGVQELARDLGVNEKTIRRDLVTLASVGFPLAETTVEHGRKLWRLADGAAVPGLSFALDEALALYLGRRLLEPLAGTFFWQAAQNAFRKIRASLGQPALNYLDRMAGRLHHTAVGASDYSARGELIDQLVRGVEERRATMIHYRSLRATEPVEHEVHPLGLVHHRGALYLVAFSRDHGEVRHFKLDRVAEAHVGEFPFEPPADFDLQAHLAGSWGVYGATGDVRVRARFQAAAARYVEEGRWHASQRLSPERDGSLVAEFRLSGTEEIKRWLLSFGQQVEVLEPAELREEIVDELASTSRNYTGKSRRIRRPVPR
jgi:proteasome accessory factor B